jgi:RNA polymerase sigma factor (sigma-70 family)
MPSTSSTPLLQFIRSVLVEESARTVTDHELLRRFAEERAETAFEAILRRHGAMVLDICRGVLACETDVEDAFQATFLVLATKARSIKRTEALASWLHGTAYRIALKARAATTRRGEQEARVRPREVTVADQFTWAEIRATLHEELANLPEPHRTVLGLCYLQGKTQDEVAHLSGLSKGTLKRRLEAGREQLRERLIRRGLGPVAVLLAAVWPGGAVRACVPAGLVKSTLQVAAGVAVGIPAAVSPSVAVLAQGGSRPMVTKTVTCAVLVVCGLLGWAEVALPPPTVQVASAAPVPKSAELSDPVTQLDEVADGTLFHLQLTRGAVSALKREREMAPGRLGIWMGGTPVFEVQDRVYRAMTQELKTALSPEQVEELVAIENTIRAKFEKASPPLEGDRERVRRELRREYTKSVNEFWGRALMPEQLKRFAQIERQFLGALGGPGAGGLGFPRIQDALKLTADQREQIRAICARAKADWEAKAGLEEWDTDDVTGEKVLVRANGPARHFKLFSSARDAAAELLTAEQRKAWRELTGEPIDLEPIVGRGSTLGR